MAETYNENLLKVLRLTREMLATADEGDRDRNDDSCGILYGILRDMAYRLRTLTEEECKKHKNAGKWSDESKTVSFTTNSQERN
jgi:hypothetical protein